MTVCDDFAAHSLTTPRPLVCPDGICRSSPACERAVLETVAALRKEGHEVVEFVPPNRESEGSAWRL